MPRGRAALGYTLQLPTADRYMLSQSQLIDRLKGILGGRAADEILLGEVSSGAENDLEQATALARQAVCQFGMGESVGLMHCAHRLAETSREGQAMVQRDCSEATARAIDDEVMSLLDDASAADIQILQLHRNQLERVSSELLSRETLDRKEFEQPLGANG